MATLFASGRWPDFLSMASIKRRTSGLREVLNAENLNAAQNNFALCPRCFRKR
jgi:hypothetical protein